MEFRNHHHQFNDFGTRFDVHRVLVVDRLNVPERRVNFRELQEKWSHIADLELDEVSVTPVTLPVASDVPELIVPLETRCGPKGSPVGVRTKLGLPACRRLLFRLLHAEKGRLRNAVANRVPASCWVPKILGTRCDRLTHSAHCLT